MPTINRKYKDTVFRRLFGEGEKENLLSLYNALNNSHYENPDELEITTIEDAIYMGKKNDVSFIIDDTLTLMEHQSTFSPNLPLRGLMYFAKVYEGQLGDDMQIIYSSFDLKIPFPKYYVLYNGERKIPERMELKLSDMYIKKEGKICDLECIAHIININYGNNKKLLNACKTLNDYAKLISEIRNRRKDGKITYESIDEAVDYCIEHNILKEFLLKHKSEVVGMFLTEFDQKKYDRVVGRLYREEGFKQGEKCGEARGIKLGENNILINLIKKGIITKDEALKEASNKDAFLKMFETCNK